MSQIFTEELECPGCGQFFAATLFRSLNGALLPEQVEALLSGSFELQRCAACGETFRHEHRMLYSHLHDKLWVAVYPPQDRPRFAEIEHNVALRFEREFSRAPAVVAARVSGVRPYLVFGLDALAERIRCRQAGIEPAILESLKMVALRRRLAELYPAGPVELRLEACPEGEPLSFGVYAFGTGERLRGLEVERDLLESVSANRREYEAAFPGLFSRPFVSAARYLLRR